MIVGNFINPEIPHFSSIQSPCTHESHERNQSPCTQEREILGIKTHQKGNRARKL